MFLSEKGKKVVMLDMLPEIAPNMPIYTKWVLNSKLAEFHITVKTNHEITKMTGKHVKCINNGKELEYTGDAVICALGQKSRRTLLDELRTSLKDIEIIPVGDVNSPRKIMQAVHEGFHAARRV